MQTISENLYYTAINLAEQKFTELKPPVHYAKCDRLFIDYEKREFQFTTEEEFNHKIALV